MVQPHVVLLRGDANEWKRQLGVAVVTCRVNRMRHDIADHPIGHGLHDALIRKMIQNGSPQCAHDLLALRRKLFQVFFRGGSGDSHGSDICLAAEILRTWDTVECWSVFLRRRGQLSLIQIDPCTGNFESRAKNFAFEEFVPKGEATQII